MANDPRAAQAVAMYRAGIEVDEITRTLRCGTTTLGVWLREADVRRRGRGKGPNAYSWAHTVWNKPHAVTWLAEERWDIDALIAVSEARNAAIVANDCSSFPRERVAA